MTVNDAKEFARNQARAMLQEWLNEVDETPTDGE